jgi:hypothetical protein
LTAVNSSHSLIDGAGSTSNGAKSPQRPVREQRNLKPDALTNVDRLASNEFAGDSMEDCLNVSANCVYA